MNPGRFYIPNYMGMSSIPASNYTTGIVNTIPRKIGLFSRITHGIRSINWNGLLTSANKTLNVVNQTIPLIRQAGPMVNNMKSMLKIAKVFGRETTSNRKRNINNYSNNSNYGNINVNNRNSNQEILEQKKEEQNDNAPNFFV